MEIEKEWQIIIGFIYNPERMIFLGLKTFGSTSFLWVQLTEQGYMNICLYLTGPEPPSTNLLVVCFLPSELFYISRAIEQTELGKLPFM